MDVRVIATTNRDMISEVQEKKFREDAKNRIELGLILQEVGKAHNITVTPEEMNKALFEYASNFKGQEQKVIDLSLIHI